MFSNNMNNKMTEGNCTCDKHYSAAFDNLFIS